MARPVNLTAPEMSNPACLHHDHMTWQLAEDLRHLRSPRLSAQDRSAGTVGSMPLKHIRRQALGE